MSKPFVFTLMPFDKSFHDTYKLGIKAAVEDAGGYCERVDEQVYEERMLDRIYNQINKADFIIADVTGRNPNVFYEIGYAHALEKRVLLLARTPDDIPFDLKHHYHVVYDGQITVLKDELVKRLGWYFANPQEKIQNSEQLEFYIDQNKIIDNGTVTIFSNGESFFLFERHRNPFTNICFRLNVHNFSDKEFNSLYKVGIVISSEFDITIDNLIITKIILPENKIMYTTTNYVRSIFPKNWENIFEIIISTNEYDKNIIEIEIPITLKIFTVLGVKAINFILVQKYLE